MALDHDEFLRLSKIADSLRRSDPELARKLAGPVRPRSYRSVLCYLALSVFALVALTTAAMGDATTPSTVAKNASHTAERTAVESRAQVRNEVDWKPTVRHAPPMRSPVDFGAEAP
ncbi:hypothetical protein GCM10010464_21680 [Pseudonocardia yunnanensis]|uniref:DUF3040 domain-containing protein n=1 Tax=Pseudonocardia yunnanensis TaxID=58107 RepID=A0ABW4EUM2_9PSEU